MRSDDYTIVLPLYNHTAKKRSFRSHLRDFLDTIKMKLH